MKDNLKVTYTESQDGNNRVLNVKISTLKQEHQDILQNFKSRDSKPEKEKAVHLKLEDLIK